jgi:hypothetical protein
VVDTSEQYHQAEQLRICRRVFGRAESDGLFVAFVCVVIIGWWCTWGVLMFAGGRSDVLGSGGRGSARTIEGDGPRRYGSEGV